MLKDGGDAPSFVLPTEGLAVSEICDRMVRNGHKATEFSTHHGRRRVHETAIFVGGVINTAKIFDALNAALRPTE